MSHGYIPQKQHFSSTKTKYTHRTVHRSTENRSKTRNVIGAFNGFHFVQIITEYFNISRSLAGGCVGYISQKQGLTRLKQNIHIVRYTELYRLICKNSHEYEQNKKS